MKPVIITVSLIAMALYLPMIKYIMKRPRSLGRFAPFAVDEKRRRLPGETIRREADMLVIDILLPVVAIPALLLIPVYTVFLTTAPVSIWIAVIGCVAGVAYCLYTLINKYQLFCNAQLGAEGEEYTGQELNQLMKHGVDVFHDVPYAYGNIDHIVVGWDFVFVVETKAVRKPKGKKKNSRLKDVTYNLSLIHI